MPTLCVCRPVILDPADPTGILGQDKDWDLMAEEAAKYCSTLPCLQNVQPWNVQVRLPEPVSITVPVPLPLLSLPTRSPVPAASPARDH